MSHVSFFLELGVCDCACDLDIRTGTIMEPGDITDVLPLCECGSPGVSPAATWSLIKSLHR